MFLYSLLHSLSELPELVLAPAVTHTELRSLGRFAGLRQTDGADVGHDVELIAHHQQSEVVVVVLHVQVGVFLVNWKEITERSRPHLR